jgi:hypothetical protein
MVTRVSIRILLFLNIRSFCGVQEKPEDSRQNTVNRKKKKVIRIVLEYFVLIHKKHWKSADVVRKISFRYRSVPSDNGFMDIVL